ncbi:MAG: hypothetical protein JOZ83_03645 [Silvibacterium sp.]|nr:hypothetical protein [Silvibacterium sp.]
MISATATKISTAAKVYFAGYLFLSLAAVFYLPRLVPVRPAAAASYVFGYNNRLAIVLFVLLTAIGAAWWYKLGFGIPESRYSAAVDRKTLWICIAVAVAVCGILYILTSKLSNFGYFFEPAYFINRIELTRQGLRPYRDFEFAYGAALIYLPLWVSKFFHINIPAAYYLFWMISAASGIWLLAEIINKLDYQSEQKRQVFLLVYLYMLPFLVAGGINYTGFRYTIAPFCGLLVWRALRNGKLRNLILGSVCVPACTVGLLLISPELAIAFSLGTSVFMLFFFARLGWKAFLPYVSMLLLLSLVMATVNRLGVLATLKTIGSGGLNYPIIPAPHILLLFVAVFLCASYLIVSLMKGKRWSNTVLLLLIAAPALTAAMSICDLYHVGFNVLVVWIVSLLIVGNQPDVWRWYRWVFLGVFAVSSVATLWQYEGALSEAAHIFLFRAQSGPLSKLEKLAEELYIRRFGETIGIQKVRNYQSLAAGESISDSPWVPAELKGTAQVPFGYFVTHNPAQVDWGYYFTLENAFDRQAVVRKIEELKNHPTRELLLPAGYEGSCTTDAEGLRNRIRRTFLFPYRARALNTESIYEPLCAYISAHYVLSAPPGPNTKGYAIWEPKQNH